VLKTFHKGGIHPPENKFSADQPVQRLPLPDTVTIPISQHIGAPSEPLVAKGDKVKTGQIIAKSKGFVSANIFIHRLPAQ
jgi:Na+-translocating ferredoxin:NAD+ oxidoreductase subunit C